MAEFDPDAYLKREKKPQGFDPDAYLAKTAPETRAQTFGRSTISMADSALNALTGTMDIGARALARAYYGGVKGMAGPELEQRIAQETTSPKDVVGRAFGVTGTAGYEQAPLRQLGTYIGEAIGENVIQPVAQATGLSPEYVGDVVAIGSAPLAGPTGRAVTATGRGVATAARNAPEFARGVAGQVSGRGTAPGQPATYAGQYQSARQPAGQVYHTPENLQAWREGRITTEELNQKAVSYTPQQEAALRQTGGMVPYTGQVARAAGEAFAEPYTRLSGYVPDLLLTGAGYALGGPLGAGVAPAVNMLRRGVQAVGAARELGAMRQLGDLGFTPLYPEELAAMRTGRAHPSDIGPVNMQPGTAGFDFRTASQAANAGVAGPVAPVVAAEPVAAQPVPRLTYNPTPPTIFVAPEGVAGTDIRAVNRAGIEQKYPAVTVGPVVPDVEAAAAAQAAKDSATRQKILDLINKAEEKGKIDTTPRPLLPGEPPAIGPAPVTTAPSAEVLSSISELGKKSLPEIRFDIKNTGKGAITTKDNKVILDKAAYDDLAAQHGVKLNWDELGEIKKGMADAREQVNKFVLDKIKEQRGPEKRGPQMRTLQKQAERELGIGEPLTPEQEAIVNARMAAGQGLIKGMPSARTGERPVTPVAPPGAAAPAQGAGMSEALRQRLEALRAKGGYKPPDVSEMMTGPSVHKNISDAASDAMIQSVRNPDSFTVSYRDGDRVIHETKQPNYHAVEIDFPDGTTQKMTENTFGGEKYYSQVAMNGFQGQAKSLPGGNVKPADWITVLDKFTKR